MREEPGPWCLLKPLDQVHKFLGHEKLETTQDLREKLAEPSALPWLGSCIQLCPPSTLPLVTRMLGQGQDGKADFSVAETGRHQWPGTIRPLDWQPDVAAARMLSVDVTLAGLAAQRPNHR
jgi:hypothetical protein